MDTAFIVLMVATLGSLALVIIAFSQYFKSKKALSAVEAKTAPVDALRLECERLKSDYEGLQRKYGKLRVDLKEFEKIIDTYHVSVGTMDAATYKPLYKKRDISYLEKRLSETVEKSKDLVRTGKACVSLLGDDLRLNGRKAAAKTFVNREIRLRIRCLDNEVKAAIAIVDWNNIGRLLDRIKRKFRDINNDSSLVKIFLAEDYLAAKLLELRISFEIQQLKADLKEEEREERQRIREEQRDEERLKVEVAKAERQRQRMEKLVEQELAKIGEVTEAQRSKLSLLQRELELVREREQRALSMAQQTRAGFVYIISNEASFGPGICKIGMTRRLDPNDRVKELGDASVPEFFNVHHFLYTEDAPSLEKYFHDKLADKRVNLVNRRKEFFRVSPETAVKLIKGYSGTIKMDAVEA